MHYPGSAVHKCLKWVRHQQQSLLPQVPEERREARTCRRWPATSSSPMGSHCLPGWPGSSCHGCILWSCEKVTHLHIVWPTARSTGQRPRPYGEMFNIQVQQQVYLYSPFVIFISTRKRKKTIPKAVLTWDFPKCHLTFQYMKLTGSTTVGCTISLPGKMAHVTALGCMSWAFVVFLPWIGNTGAMTQNV